MLLPLAILLIARSTSATSTCIEAAQTATAGLITLIPEGLVLLMSVTFAVAAVRLAKRDTLVQQMSATEILASVDTICVDKTGTLTDGELTLVGIEFAYVTDTKLAAAAALGRFAASAGDRNQTLEAIGERFPAEAEPVCGEVPFSSEWKWCGARLRGRRRRRSAFVLGAPDLIDRGRRADPAPGMAESCGARPRPAAASSPSARPASRCPTTRPRRPAPRLEPVALVVLEETLRPGRRRDARASCASRTST